MPSPFVTFVMRCCKRPVMMREAIDSTLEQTDPDFEIVFIPDFEQRGVKWANRQFAVNKHRCDGQYIYALDDDSKIVYPRLVEELKQIEADVVMVKGKRPRIKPYVLPKKDVWGNRGKLRIRSTNGACFISSREVWIDNCAYYGEGGSGDWNYLKAVNSNSDYKFYWLDQVVKEAQKLSRGSVEPNCPANWFESICKEYGVVEVASGDWRLQCHLR